MKWLDTEAAAEYIGFAPKTLANWRAMDPSPGPAFKRIGRAIRYDRDALDDFMESAAA